ncbi:MAG: matrixin family metalloprotease [Candidatus Nanopelagicales bacterium]
MAGQSGIRRVVRVIGGALAGVLIAGVCLGLYYGMANFEELKGTVPTLSGMTDEDTELRAAADSAVGYAESFDHPPESTHQGRGFRFNAPPPAGVTASPGHWCGGQVIGYRIDYTAALLAGSNRAKEQLRWNQAFSQWSRASGGRYLFEYRGAADYPLTDAATTKSYPIDPDLVPEGEIAISYGVPSGQSGSKWDDYRHPTLADTLGFAGLGPISWSSGPQQSRITRAMIVMDAIDSEADPRTVPTPYVHEAGHALGLAHVPDPGQMMYDTATSLSEIADGDRNGIQRLAAMTCR